MNTKLTQRKPRYFFATFGDPGTDKPKVDGGSYPHKGYISSLDMMPGDVIVMYCTLPYAEHPMEAPGIGIVTGTTDERISYQYYPLDGPISWDRIKESLKDNAERLQNLSLKGNWLFEIKRASFRAVLKGRTIDWP